MNIVWKPVKNYSSGRFGYKPEAIVIHIAEGYLEGGYAWFNNPTSQASSHYMVGKSGVIWQFVKDADTSWHAGGVNQPRWALLKPGINPNLYTIGIEHEGFTSVGWPNAMYDASAELIAKLCIQYKIPLDRNHIIGHNQINSVSRENCPGSGVNLDILINLAKRFYDDPMVIDELNKKIEQLNAEINSLRNENNNLKTKNAQLQNLVKEYTDSSNDLSQLKQENANLRREVIKLQESQEKLNKVILELEKKLKNIPTKPNENNDEKKESVWDIIKTIITGK